MTQVVEYITRSCFYVIFKNSHKPTFFTCFSVGVVVCLAFMGVFYLY